MSTRTDPEYTYFARVPNRLLADLRSAEGPVLTFVEADGQLHLNQTAANALPRQPQATPELSALLDPPLLFMTSRRALIVSRGERRSR